MSNYKSAFSSLTVSLTILFSGCASNDGTDINMPPKAPVERIQSSIFPDNRPATEATPPPAAPDQPADSAPVVTPAPENTAPALPPGIRLKLKGKEVDFDILATVPDPQKRTVTVSALPSTPYRDVADILDRLHAMGFLVTFKAGE